MVTLMSCMVILPIIYIYDMPITVHSDLEHVGVVMAGFMALGAHDDGPAQLCKS